MKQQDQKEVVPATTTTEGLQTQVIATTATKCPYASLSMFGGGGTTGSVMSALHPKISNESDDVVSNNDSSTTTASTTGTVNDSNEYSVLNNVYNKCPAFQNGSCPFKDKKDSESVRETLLQIPSSHLQKDQHEFYQVLQQLHKNTPSASSSFNESGETTIDNTTAGNNNNNNNNRFQLPGGCPVANSTVFGPKLLSKFKLKLMNNTNIVDDVDKEQQQQQQKLSFTEAMENYSLASIMARMASMHDNSNDEEFHVEELASTNSENNNNQDIASIDSPSVDVSTIATMIDVDTVSAIDPSVTDTSLQTASVVPTTEKQQQQQQQPKLSECFKVGTIESHQAAEDVHFVKNFIRGQIDRELYKDLVVQLYYVYNTLEEYVIQLPLKDQQQAQQHTQQPQPQQRIDDLLCLRTFIPFHQQLQRKQTLIDDLDFWFGSNIASAIVSGATTVTGSDIPHQSVACKEYVDRLHYIATNEPLLLLAHSYTRYLGDLSGGKILARVAKRALDLGSSGDKKTPVDGLAFYDFATTIPSAKKFKDEYKNVLDLLPLTMEQISRLVQEANVAFVLNMRLFEELDVKGNVPNATVRSLQDALAYGTKEYISCIEEEATAETANDIDDTTTPPKEAAKCPFAIIPTITGHYSKTSFAKSHGKETINDSKKKPEKCPFANLSAVGGEEELKSTKLVTNDNTVPSKQKIHDSSSRCPWPFIFAHDPIQGLLDWKTWAFVGLFFSYCWFQFLSSSSKATISASFTS